MKKSEFLVYLLSTVPITPTSAMQTAFAEDSSNKNINSDKMEQYQSQKETSKQFEKDRFNSDDSKYDSDDKKSTSNNKDLSPIYISELTRLMEYF